MRINPDKMVDEFNEYMFEKTSKIPMEEIEKAVYEEDLTDMTDILREMLEKAK